MKKNAIELDIFRSFLSFWFYKVFFRTFKIIHSKQEVLSLMPSPALAHAFSLHPAVSSCYLKLCGYVQPWNQDAQKVCKMCSNMFVSFLNWNEFSSNFSGNVENLNLDNLSRSTNIWTLHHSSGQNNCCFQNRTHEAWEGGAEAQLTFSLPSPLFPPCAPLAQHLSPPVPTFLLPVSLALLDLTPSSSSSKPQSAKPNVLPRAGEHFHHRLHQSASEVWRAHCAGVSHKLQMLLITSVNKTSCDSLFYVLKYVSSFVFFVCVCDSQQINRD